MEGFGVKNFNVLEPMYFQCMQHIVVEWWYFYSDLSFSDIFSTLLYITDAYLKSKHKPVSFFFYLAH